MIQTIQAKTCGEAWLAASKVLAKQEHLEATNVVLEIAEPDSMTESDKRVVGTVDGFLHKYDQLPVVTVANTIFPGGLYATFGVEGVYKIYPDQVYPKLKEGWGTYAYRLVRRVGPTGKEMNPLATLIEKMKTQLARTSTLGRAYELNTVDIFADLPLYEATQDAGRGISHPCLSHISLRIDDRERLSMTAIYRSHFYVQKALGNLLGLAQLLVFLGRETGLSTGTLVVHSIYAVLDRRSNAWGKKEALQLVEDCEEAAAVKAA